MLITETPSIMASISNILLVAGATLCKGLNRGLGTVIAGALAFSVKYVANGFDNGSDRVFHALFIGTTVCIIGTSLILGWNMCVMPHIYQLLLLILNKSQYTSGITDTFKSKFYI